MAPRWEFLFLSCRLCRNGNRELLANGYSLLMRDTFLASKYFEVLAGTHTHHYFKSRETSFLHRDGESQALRTVVSSLETRLPVPHYSNIYQHEKS
jgi:hypothetical protein